MSGPRLAALMANSFSIAITALIAVIAGALMAYAGRLTRSPIVQFGNRVAGLGYAIPGAVIAVGVLVPSAGSTTCSRVGSRPRSA